MTYTHLEQLEQKFVLKKINRRVEIRNLSILLIIVGLMSFSIINFNLIKIYAQDIMGSNIQTEVILEQKKNKAIEFQQNNHTNPIQIKEIIDKYSQSKTHIPVHAAPLLKDSLEQKRTSYHLPFNTLAPTKKLVINDLQIDVPIISHYNKSFEEVAKGDFTKELMQGVALFPGTSEPGTKGKHSIIFGHSSYEFWENNEFGTTFAKLHTLEPGSTFSIVREGKKLDYKILDKQIIKPSEIKAIYEKWNNQPGINYLTLLACYPPGSTLKRVVTIAKQIN